MKGPVFRTRFFTSPKSRTIEEGEQVKEKVYRWLTRKIPGAMEGYEQLRLGGTSRKKAWPALAGMALREWWSGERPALGSRKRLPEGGSASLLTRRESPEEFARKLARCQGGYPGRVRHADSPPGGPAGHGVFPDGDEASVSGFSEAPSGRGAAGPGEKTPGARHRGSHLGGDLATGFPAHWIAFSGGDSDGTGDGTGSVPGKSLFSPGGPGAGAAGKAAHAPFGHVPVGFLSGRFASGLRIWGSGAVPGVRGGRSFQRGRGTVSAGAKEAGRGKDPGSCGRPSPVRRRTGQSPRMGTLSLRKCP